MAKLKTFTQNPGNSAICYYRYSSDAQREVSIEQQKEAAAEYCERNKLKIIKEYADKAISGSRDDRPEFLLMLSEVKRMRPAYLVLWKTDRLSRDRVTSTIAKKQLRDNGVKIVYVAEPIPDDDEATEVLLESIYEGMAQSFLLQHRKNVMRGLNYNAEKGLYNGRKTLGYVGKPDCPYEIDEQTAPIVTKIFKNYAAGVSMKKIIDDLNGSGIKTSRGQDFTINSIRAILQNRSYIGEYKWGEHIIPDGMPRIISDELFEQVQVQLAKNKRGGGQAERKLVPDASADYWLTGKLFCGECGASMQGVSGTSRHGYKCYYYYCSDHRKKLCNMGNKRKDIIEEIVLYVLNDLVNDTALQIMLADRCYNYYKSEHSDSGAYIASLEASIKDTEKKYDNIVEAIENGAYTKKMNERMRDLETRLDLLKEELEAEKLRQKCELSREDILRYLHSFIGDMSKPENRDNVLDLLIDKIYIYGDEMTITFSYTEDRRTLKYDEMKNLLDGRKVIDDMMDGQVNPENVPPDLLKSMTDSGGGGSDFF